jgi:flagellar basal body rod protein FlgG
MTDGLYVGMAAASARMTQLDSIADNLANADTPGFVASRPAFHEMLPGDPGAPRDRRFALVTASEGGIDRRRGAAIDTGRPLDLYIASDSFFSVKMEDGRTAYTRDGRVQVSAQGRLEIGGRALLDDGGNEITAPADAAVRVDAKGRVVVDGTASSTIGTFAIDGGADRAGASLLLPHDDAAVTPVESDIKSGMHEGSNAKALDAAVAMVSAERSFDHAMQAIQTVRQLDEKATEIGRVRG